MDNTKKFVHPLENVKRSTENDFNILWKINSATRSQSNLDTLDSLVKWVNSPKNDEDDLLFNDIHN